MNATARTHAPRLRRHLRRRRSLPGSPPLAVLFAIYTAMTVRDPMAKRVKALNERRDELKAGIITPNRASAQSLVQRTETTDKMKDTSAGHEGPAGKPAQDHRSRSWRRPAIRNKELAVCRHLRAAWFCRSCSASSPCVLIYWAQHVRRTGAASSASWRSPRWSFAGYKGARAVPEEQGQEAHPRDPQGSARRARPAGDLRRSRPDRRRRVQPRGEGTGPRLSRARRRIRADRDRAVVPDRTPPGVREPRLSCRSRRGARRGHDDDPDRKIRHPARLARCACCRPSSATSA